MIDHIRLRDLCADDLPTMYRHQIDPESVAMALVNPRKPEDFQAHWTRVLTDTNNVTQAILLDDEVVGHISCFKMDGKDHVGYWIAREHWGKGIASRALALLLEKVTVRPLHAMAARSNPASIRVLERNGFRITGYHMCTGEDPRYPACEEADLILL